MLKGYRKVKSGPRVLSRSFVRIPAKLHGNVCLEHPLPISGARLDAI